MGDREDHGVSTVDDIRPCKKYPLHQRMELIPWFFFRFIAVGTALGSLLEPAWVYFMPRVSFWIRYWERRRNYRVTVWDRGSILPVSRPDRLEFELLKAPCEAESTALRVLLNETNLRTIAQYSHYTDMRNLHLTCKAMRARVKPETLMRDCCVNGTKAECWGCLIQVCKVCFLTILHDGMVQPFYR
jgi:hypothetical protein